MGNVLEKYLYTAFIIIAVIVNIIRRINKSKNTIEAPTKKKSTLEELQELIDPKPKTNEISGNYDEYEAPEEEYLLEELLVKENQVKKEEPQVTKIDSFDGVEGTSVIKDKPLKVIELEDTTKYSLISPEDFADTDKLKKAFLYSEIFNRKEY